MMNPTNELCEHHMGYGEYDPRTEFVCLHARVWPKGVSQLVEASYIWMIQRGAIEDEEPSYAI